VDIAPGAGGIISTASDMAKWMRFQLSGGKSPTGKELVKQEVLYETHKPHMQPFELPQTIQKPLFPISDIYSNVDLGWFTNIDRGKIFILEL
jgi:CubicO group peptidase (beta-lactamase class C family)